MDLKELTGEIKARFASKGQKMARVFQSFDYNGRGRLSAHEVRLGCYKQLNLELTEEQACAIHRQNNKAGDGALVYSDFVHLMQAHHTGVFKPGRRFRGPKRGAY